MAKVLGVYDVEIINAGLCSVEGQSHAQLISLRKRIKGHSTPTYDSLTLAAVIAAYGVKIQIAILLC